MSLIQEALKRQQEEMSRQNDGKAAATAAAEQPPAPPQSPQQRKNAPSIKLKQNADAPPPPTATLPATDEEVIVTPLPAIPGPPVPKPPAQPAPPALPQKPPAAATRQSSPGNGAEAGKKRSKTPMIILLVLLLLLLIGYGATMGARYLAQRAESSLGNVVAQLPAALEKAVAASQQTSANNGQAASTQPPPPAGNGAQTIVDTAETQGANIGATDLTATIPTTGDETTPPETPKQWPHIKLTAIVGKGKNGGAILNGEVVATGDVIDQVTVLAIEKDGVQLEFNGERRFLRTGSHIE